MKDHTLVRSPMYVSSVKGALLQKASSLDMEECTLVGSPNGEMYSHVEATSFILNNQSLASSLTQGAGATSHFWLLQNTCAEYLAECKNLTMLGVFVKNTIFKKHRGFTVFSVSQKSSIYSTPGKCLEIVKGEVACVLLMCAAKKALPPHYTTPVLSAVQ